MLSYPWSSLVWYVAAKEHRPEWMRVDRLLGEHGIQEDTAAGRQEFERRMETRRTAEEDPGQLQSLRRGWCLGSREFTGKLALAARLRTETVLSTKSITARVHLGRYHTAATNLRSWMQETKTTAKEKMK